MQFQSRKRLYNHRCLFFCSFVCLSAKPLNSLKSSSFIIHPSSSFVHPSSFFIHPSFISQLLSYSASLLLCSLMWLLMIVLLLYIAQFIYSPFPLASAPTSLENSESSSSTWTFNELTIFCKLLICLTSYWRTFSALETKFSITCKLPLPCSLVLRSPLPPPPQLELLQSYHDQNSFYFAIAQNIYLQRPKSEIQLTQIM